MEGTLEKIEEAAKLNDVIKVAKLRQFNNFLRRPWILPTVTAVGGITVGYVVGYMRTKRQYDRIEEKLEDLEARQDVVEEVKKWAPTTRQVDPEESRWQGVSDIQDAA